MDRITSFGAWLMARRRSMRGTSGVRELGKSAGRIYRHGLSAAIARSGISCETFASLVGTFCWSYC
jgi:hypothetical protein